MLQQFTIMLRTGCDSTKYNISLFWNFQLKTVQSLKIEKSRSLSLKVDLNWATNIIFFTTIC